MDTRKIILSKLKFLIDDYGFAFYFEENEGNHYYFKNKYGIFKYYEWAQFNESEFSVKYDYTFTIINMYLESPLTMSKIQKKKTGLKGLFYDERNDYFEEVSRIIKNSIEKTGTIYGLKVDKTN